jgi:hypothetical protein
MFFFFFFAEIRLGVFLEGGGGGDCDVDWNVPRVWRMIDRHKFAKCRHGTVSKCIKLCSINVFFFFFLSEFHIMALVLNL